MVEPLKLLKPISVFGLHNYLFVSHCNDFLTNNVFIRVIMCFRFAQLHVSVLRYYDLIFLLM